MESFGKTFGTFFEERLSNPLISSFVIAWSLYNYKVFIILFSKNTVTETFSLIHQRFPDLSAVAVHGVLLPAVFAALYLFALPFPTRWVYKWVREKQKAIDDIRDEYEAHKRLTREQSVELRRSMREQEASLDEVRRANRELQEELKQSQQVADNARLELQSEKLAKESAEKQVENLKLLMLAHRKQNTPKPDVPPAPDGSSTDDEDQSAQDLLPKLRHRLLELIGAADRITREDLRNKVKGDKITFDFALQDLGDQGDVSTVSSASGTYFVITQQGRRQLLGRK